MWQKTLIQVCMMVFYLSCVLTLSSALPAASSKEYDLDMYRRLYRPLSRPEFGLFPKRGCSGFPCMYTHLGAKAGRQALMRSLMSLIDGCANDPTCSPGKRRKRSQEEDLGLKDSDDSLHPSV